MLMVFLTSSTMLIGVVGPGTSGEWEVACDIGTGGGGGGGGRGWTLTLGGVRSGGGGGGGGGGAGCKGGFTYFGFLFFSRGRHSKLEKELSEKSVSLLNISESLNEDRRLS